MTTTTNQKPRLERSSTSGGWNRASGYAQYSQKKMKWAITDLDGYPTHFERKCDAIAVWAWAENGWDGTGDLETAWINRHLRPNNLMLPEGYKGTC